MAEGPESTGCQSGVLLVVSHTRVVILLRRLVVQKVGAYLPAQVEPVHSWSQGVSGQLVALCVPHEVVTQRSPTSNNT